MRHSFKTFFFALILFLLTGGQAEAGRDRDEERKYKYGYKVGECREYQQAVFYKGRQQFTYGTACLRRGGNWEVVTSSLPYERIRTAGPVIIMPERDRYNHSYVVIQDRPGPTIIYKDRYPHGHHHKKPYFYHGHNYGRDRDRDRGRDRHSHRDYDRDDNSLALQFKW